MKFLFIFGILALSGCVSSSQGGKKGHIEYKIGNENSPGYVKGYLDHGYEFRVFASSNLEGECISGRFDIRYVETGIADEFEVYDGGYVKMFGRVEEPFVNVELGEDELSIHTNVRDYCDSGVVIIATDVKKIKD